jgi:hypothetical protein
MKSGRQNVTSFRRKISSKANAALSTGPRTEAGKRRSSLNALRHGGRSTHLVIPDEESRREFDKLLQSHLSQLHPRTPAERACVQEMVAATWRLHCVRATETRMLNEAIAAQVPGDPQTGITDAFQRLINVPGFAILSRYETTRQMNFDRALRNLRRPTERYLGYKQKIRNAVNDNIGLGEF